MRAFVSIIMASAFFSAPALAVEQAPFQIVSQDTQGDCGDVDAEVVMQDGRPRIDVFYTDLSVEANPDQTRVRRNCNLRLRLRIDSDYRLSLTDLVYEGKVDIEDDSGTGNVSARAYLSGLPSMNGFKSFRGAQSENFTVAVDQGPAPTQCGGETTLNLLVDMTARSGRGEFSEIAIQRGAGASGAPQYKSRIQCVIDPDPCQ